MYVVKVAEASFSAEGEEYAYLVANLLFLLREYARARNAVDAEASASPDRTVTIDRNKRALRHRIFFNIKKEDCGRFGKIVDNYLADFVSRMLPSHVTYSFRILKRQHT